METRSAVCAVSAPSTAVADAVTASILTETIRSPRARIRADVYGLDLFTQVEHEEMERIMDEARSDAKLNQIECDIQLVKMSYADFLEYDNQSTIKSTSQLSASARAAKLFKTHAEQSESSDAEI